MGKGAGKEEAVREKGREIGRVRRGRKGDIEGR